MPRRTARDPHRPRPAPSSHEALAAHALRQFRQIFKAVKTHFQQMEKTAGVGGSQVWAMSAIREQADLTVGELAKVMDIHQSTASNLVRTLVERGYVATERRSADARVVYLRLTPEGRKVLGRVPQPFTGVLPDALLRLETDTLARLHEDLAKVIEQIEGVDPSSAQSPLSDL